MKARFVCLLGFSIILRSTDNLFYLTSQPESPYLIIVVICINAIF